LAQFLGQYAHLNDGTPVTTSYTYNSLGEVLTMTDPLLHVEEQEGRKYSQNYSRLRSQLCIEIVELLSARSAL
jgi:YD repeat-containing protein